MNYIKAMSLVLFSVMASCLFGQDDGSIGSWRTHLPCQQVIDVEVFGDMAYAATPFELFYYDQEDNSINMLNKVNGLSDVGVSTIRYNKSRNVLFVAYSNANVDLIDAQGNVVNMSDIMDKDILGNKTINNVVFDGDMAYVACGFGIVVFDLKRQEVKDTYYIGRQGRKIDVRDIAFYEGRIYASTEEGVYFAPMDAPNLANYEAWSLDTSLANPHFAYDEMEVFGDKLFLNYNGGYSQDTLYVNDGQQWNRFNVGSYYPISELRACDDFFMVSCKYNVIVYDRTLSLVYNFWSPAGENLEPLSATMDKRGVFWIGDNVQGMIMTTNGHDGMAVKPNGPMSKNIFQLQAFGNQVWIATGGHQPNWSKRYMKDGVCRFDGSWKCFNWKEDQDFLPYSDFVCTATDPMDPSVTYVGTWGYGILKIKDDKLVGVYNAENSTLEPWTADPQWIMVSGLAFDSKGNLWVANSGATHLLSVMERNGMWHSYYLGGTLSGIDISTLTIDNHDIKWIIRRVGQENQVLVFNDNGTLDVTSDDQVIGLTKEVGGLPGNAVNCLAVDVNDVVWVGTDSGPCKFDDSRKLFTVNGYSAVQPMVPRNDSTQQADPLFDGSNVLSMAIDGGGNKWFGLETGVYVISDKDRQLTLKKWFNTDNSPLLSNAVNSMAITADGEIFFGMTNGVVSYKGEATEPVSVISDVLVYPNPVRPEYEGYVGIKGLVADAMVKITTIDGAFVTQLRSEGGQAVWDCTTYDGQKVQPGIYLVFVSTNDGDNRFATKILVMN